MRKLLLLISSLLVVSGVFGQDSLLQIRNFGGLQTKMGLLNTPPNYARRAHNIDLSRNLGALTKRYGYDKVTQLDAVDSIVGIYGAYYGDGTQQMVLVVDPDSTNYGQIWVTNKGDNDLTGSVTEYDTVTVAVIAWKSGEDFIYDSLRYRIIYGSDTVVYQTLGGITAAAIVAKLIDSCNTMTGVTCSSCVATNKYLVKYDTVGATQRAAYSATALYTGGTWGSWDNFTSYHTYKTASIYSGVDVVWQRFSVQNRPQFAMLNDNVWIVNGDQKGVVINGEHQLARSFPIPAPGEPLIIPYHDTNTAYRISGQVRYVLEYVCYKGATAYASDLGYTTQPVNVHDGHVLITGFMPPATDSLMDDVDSIRVYLYRSVENPGRLDSRDSAYCIDTISLGTALFDTMVYIDSLPQSGAKDRPLFDYDYSGRDSLRLVADKRRPGAPGFASTAGTLSYTAATDTTRRGGIYHGIPIQQDTLGVMYACTFIDTVVAVESDTGRSLVVYVDSAKGNDQGAIPLGYTVRLPKIPESDSGLVINLYRSHVMQITYDTGYWKYWRDKEGIGDIAGPNDVNRPKRLRDNKWYVWTQDVAVDSITTTPYYLIAQIPVSDTTYTDTARFDSISVNEKIFRGVTPPPLLQGIFSYQGRLFGWKGSNLYWSLLDSAYAWGAFDFISVNPDDGSQITTAYPTREDIKVKKDNASFNVYQDDNGNWYLTEIASNRGCIAPQSHVAINDNHYYLGKNYAWAESEGGYRARQVGVQPISQTIDNLDQLPIGDKRECLAMPWENHVIFKIGDTSYVWDEKAQGWSTWSLDFDGWTYYGTETSTEFIPGDTLYFFRGNSLYRYGASEYDDSTKIAIDWISGPILGGDLSVDKTLTGLGLGTFSSGNDTLAILGYNQEDSLCSQSLFSDLTKRYIIKGIRQRQSTVGAYTPNVGLYFYLRLMTSTGTTFGNTYVDAVDVFFRRGARRTIE